MMKYVGYHMIFATLSYCWLSPNLQFQNIERSKKGVRYIFALLCFCPTICM